MDDSQSSFFKITIRGLHMLRAFATRLIWGEPKPAEKKAEEKKIETTDALVAKPFSLESIPQLDFIGERLTQFQNRRTQISNSFSTLRVFGGCAFMAATWSVLYGSGLAIAYCLLGDTFSPMGLKKNMTEGTNELKELLRIYKWMAEAGPSVTQNKTFLDLTAAIAPDIVQTDDMIPNVFAQNARHLSDGFFAALKNTPHWFSTQMRKMVNFERQQAYPPVGQKDPVTGWRAYMPGFFYSTAYNRFAQSSSQLVFSYDSLSETVPVVVSNDLGKKLA
jgi:hypothetical protein